MQHGFLVVKGVRLDQTDLNQFQDWATFHDWYADIWNAVDRHYAAYGVEKPNLIYKHECDIFDQDYIDALKATRLRIQEITNRNRIAQEMKTPFVHKGVSYDRVSCFAVMDSQGDAEAWVVRDPLDNTLAIGIHDQGSQDVVKRDYLEKRIADYKRLLAEAERVLKLFD